MAAGTIWRRDVVEEGLLIGGPSGGPRTETPYNLKQYGDIDRICRNDFTYAGNLHALAAWYACIRPLLTPDDPYAQACLRGAQRLLAAAAAERASQLEKLSGKIAAAPGPHASHQRLLALRPRLEQIISISKSAYGNPPAELLAAIAINRQPTYIETIQSLPTAARQAGTAWLQSIADAVAGHWATRR